MDNATRGRVKERICIKMDSIITRRIMAAPNDLANILIKNPFGARLVPQEVWKGSKFERSFVTSFGQGVFEQIALEIAIGSGAYARNQHVEIHQINTWQEEAINDLLTDQRNASVTLPNWENEVNHILGLSTTRFVDVNILFDLYVRRQDGTEEYYSLKTVKPNLDQTEISKRNMLRMKASKPDSEVFLALPYNPQGEGDRYTRAWSVPKKLFDMDNSPAVLIGSDFWNKVGADDNTYHELLEIFDELGDEYRDRITNEYLDV